MPFDEDTLNRIYDRTDGRCHICGKKLSFVNYAQPGQRGAWEVDHSRARAKRGTYHLTNLFPACITCNRDKRTVTSRTARAQFGRTRAPYSKEKKKKIRRFRAIAGATLGAGIGSIAGPPGTVISGIIGAIVGHESDPDKQ